MARSQWPAVSGSRMYMPSHEFSSSSEGEGEGAEAGEDHNWVIYTCLLYTSPSPRD